MKTFLLNVLFTLLAVGTWGTLAAWIIWAVVYNKGQL